MSQSSLPQFSETILHWK